MLLTLPLSAAETGPSPAAGPLMPPDATLDEAIAYLLDHADDDGCIGGARLTAWSVLALVAAGHDPHAPTEKGPSLVDGLKTCEPGRVVTDREPLTSLQRHVLAIVAAGEDPTDFNGRDWVREIRDHANGSLGFMDPNNPNSHNNDMFGILALAVAGTPNDDGVIQAAADKLLANQNNDGGWGFTADGDSDTDMTGAALQALVRAGRLTATDPAAQQALDFLIQRSLDTQSSDHAGCLSTSANMTGADLDSTSWGLLGLLAIHQDPRDTPWDNTPWDIGGGPWQCLKAMQEEDGGFPTAPGASTSPWPTTYAILALTGAPFGTLDDDAGRPEAEITISATPRAAQLLQLQAQGVAFASWQQENGTIHTGTTIEWTPRSTGLHNFTLLLIDEHGLSATQRYPVLVEADESAGTDKNDTQEKPPQDETLRTPLSLELAVNETTTTDTIVTLHLATAGANATAYRVDWGDGVLTDWENMDRLQHEYTKPGTYTISAWAKDGDENTHGPVQTTIEVDKARETDTDNLQEAPLGPVAVTAAFLLLVTLSTLRRRTSK